MFRDFLILGGAGLVGTQVVRHIVKTFDAHRIVVGSLFEKEATAACQRFEREFGTGVSFVPEWGDLFLPHRLAGTRRVDLLSDRATRNQLLDALYGEFDAAYRGNQLVRLVRRHRPEVIVDCVNTATGLSYQDIFDGAAKVRERIGTEGFASAHTGDLETFLLSQSVPQLIRHVRFVHRATIEYQTKVYLKVGTTGTGGMGMNIPYTHSEDSPSRKLLAKTEVAFGHTGLLFLLARTPGAPIVKEVKPAAMIGYKAVQVKTVRDKHGNSSLFAVKREAVSTGSTLELRQSEESYEKTGALSVAIVDTGENGLFTRGEFEAITALGQMEYVTPEEIARIVVRELRGATTGRDVISALDGAVLDPSYKAGLVRNVALRDLRQVEKASLEDGTGVPSIALGRLGPPALSKLLFEAGLLRRVYDSMQAISEARPREMCKALEAVLADLKYDVLPPSIGVPVLLSDGQTLMRGPRINVPEILGHGTSVEVGMGDLDAWAAKGWVDLREANMRVWQQRVSRMLQARRDLRAEGSAAATLESYMSHRFEIGEVVAWIFNNEMGGYRIK
ncbi:MAG TPA: hypothetical protein QGF58_16950 [Myxococcota bacterium]|nr:hypothetical protein [Myxococcota bacterium]